MTEYKFMTTKLGNVLIEFHPISKRWKIKTKTTTCSDLESLVNVMGIKNMSDKDFIIDNIEDLYQVVKFLDRI